tara:strand:- start:3041 stop:3922 length:882 start_codon:yes stop_codon:yes gene_type:complete
MTDGFDPAWGAIFEGSDDAAKDKEAELAVDWDKLNSQHISGIAKILKDAKRVLFITGSGVSVESGVPTYRGATGLYNDDDVESGLHIEEIMSGQTLDSRPELTWKYLRKIEESSRGVKPNLSHAVMAQMEKEYESVLVLTQNVDGLHKIAGSKNVIEIHGNARKLFCMACKHETIVDSYQFDSYPPACVECGMGMLRPDVVLFGEMLNEQNILEFETQLSEGFDIIFTIGTTSLFPYIISPVQQARAQGIPTVEINPEDTMLSRLVDFKIKDKAAITLDRIWKEVNNVEGAKD